jgi:HSP20 family protein
MEELRMASEIRENKRQEAGLQGSPERISPNQLFVPQADIYESKDSIILLADMPGIDQNSVDITLEKNVLTITGSVSPAEHKGQMLSHGEYLSGDYRRAFTLSNEIDRNGIEAVVKNGVLKLTLPKSKDSLPKKIVVKGGE